MRTTIRIIYDFNKALLSLQLRNNKKKQIT